MKIDDERRMNICKMGQREKCCRYLTFAAGDGFMCAKLKPDIKAVINQRIEQGVYSSLGDNCEGVDNEA